jgi:hypothetical protein
MAWAGQMEIPNKLMIKNKIWIEPAMFYSAAYQSIRKSASAINTLMRCLQKRKWDRTKVNGKKQIIYTDESFIFPYREAKIVLDIGTTQYWKNIRKLIEVGFLDLEYQGGWYQKHEKEKDYSRYKLSERWRKFDKPDFVKVEIPKALPAGFHIRENMAKQKLNVTSLKRSGQLHKSEGIVVKSDHSRLHGSEGDKTVKEFRQSLGDAV